MRVGLHLDIVLEEDLERDRVVARKAVVYDVVERLITISQTSPSFVRRHLGDRINASYVTTVGEGENKRPARMGFPATILEYREDYPLASSNLVPAFVLQQDGKPVEINLRMHYRVHPMIESDLALQANGETVNLIDISLGGIQFSHRRKEPPLKYGGIVLKLSSGSRTFRIDGQIIRIDTPVSPGGRGEDMEYVMVKFLSLNRDAEAFLGKKILMIERELIAAGKV